MGRVRVPLLGTLRRRVITLVTGTTAVVLVLLAVPLAVATREQLADRTTRETSLLAQSVADYLSTGRFDPDQLDAYVRRQGSRDDVRLQVLLPDGREVGDRLPSSAGSDRDWRRDEARRRFDPGADADGDGRRGDGDSDDDGLGSVSPAVERETADGRVVEVSAVIRGASAAAGGDGPALVRAYVGDDQLSEGVALRWAVIAASCLVLLAASAVGAELVARRLVRPLDAAATTAGRLSAGDLGARAPQTGPREVAAVATALNTLADRIGDLMAAERETVADLSHRMRTPLTAVRLSVEALPPGERTDELADHVAQLERTLSAVIRAARRRPVRDGTARSDLAAVARDRIEFWGPLLADQGRPVEVRLAPDGTAWTRCETDDLAAAVDALIENVVAHTPEGAGLAVAVHLDRGQAVLDVLDDGPGIPDAALARGHSDRGSTGLGLDIVRRCAEGGGGTTVVGRAAGRTRVRLRLPLAGDPPSASSQGSLTPT